MSFYTYNIKISSSKKGCGIEMNTLEIKTYNEKED